MTEKIELVTVESVDGDVFHDRKFEILGRREFDTVEDALEETGRISRKYHENGDQYDDLPEDYTFEKLVEEELI